MHAVGESMDGICRRPRGKISVRGHGAAGAEGLRDGGSTPPDATDGIATARTGPPLPYMSGGPARHLTGRGDIGSISKFPSSRRRIGGDGVADRSAHGAAAFDRHGFDRVA